MGRWYENKAHGYQNCCSSHISKTVNWATFFSELLGMFIFTFISSTTVASVVFPILDFTRLTNGSTTEEHIMFDSASVVYINLGCAFGYMLGLYVTIQNVGYLNPGITLMFTLVNKEPYYLLPLLIAQFVGALLASALTVAFYYGKFSSKQTAIIFCSSINGDDNVYACFDQVLKSAFFTTFVFAIIDDQKRKSEQTTNSNESNDPSQEMVYRTLVPSKSTEPFFIGLSFFTIGIAFTVHSRFYFNSIQDVVGRLMAALVIDDYVLEVWPLVILLVAPLIGSFIGMVIYVIFIEINYKVNHPQNNEETDGRI